MQPKIRGKTWKHTYTGIVKLHGQGEFFLIESRASLITIQMSSHNNGFDRPDRWLSVLSSWGRHPGGQRSRRSRILGFILIECFVSLVETYWRGHLGGDVITRHPNTKKEYLSMTKTGYRNISEKEKKIDSQKNPWFYLALVGDRKRAFLHRLLYSTLNNLCRKVVECGWPCRLKRKEETNRE